MRQARLLSLLSARLLLCVPVFPGEVALAKPPKARGNFPQRAAQTSE